MQKSDDTKVSQWVSNVTDFSSQYGNDLSLSYIVGNLAGPPTVYPKYGDYADTAVMRTYGPWWDICPSKKLSISRKPYPIRSQDYIEFEIKDLVYVTGIDVYETYNPGAIVALYAAYIDNGGSLTWKCLKRLNRNSSDESNFDKSGGGHIDSSKLLSVSILHLEFEAEIYPSNLFRIIFDHSRLDYYCELDAISVVGYPYCPSDDKKILVQDGEGSCVDPPPSLILTNNAVELVPSNRKKLSGKNKGNRRRYYDLRVDDISVDNDDDEFTRLSVQNNPDGLKKLDLNRSWNNCRENGNRWKLDGENSNVNEENSNLNGENLNSDGENSSNDDDDSFKTSGRTEYNVGKILTNLKLSANDTFNVNSSLPNNKMGGVNRGVGGVSYERTYDGIENENIRDLVGPCRDIKGPIDDEFESGKNVDSLPQTSDSSQVSLVKNKGTIDSRNMIGSQNSPTDSRNTIGSLFVPVNSKDMIGSQFCLVSYFSILPVELIQRILSLLDIPSLFRLATTCKFFQFHALHPAQFVRLDLQHLWHKVNKSALSNMEEYACQTKFLNLSWCTLLPEKSILRFLEACSQDMHILRLDNCRIRISLDAIVATFKNLRELSVRSCVHIHGDRFEILSELKGLKYLDLYRTRVSTQSALAVIKNCLQLEHINFGSCLNIKDMDSVVSEFQNLKKLISLDLWRARSLTSSGIHSLSMYCLNLEELDLGWCDIPTVVPLVHNCRRLKKLFLTANRSINDLDLEAISRYSTDLRQLDILGTREVTIPAVLRVLTGCARLELIDLSFCLGLDARLIPAWRLSFPRVNIKNSKQADPNLELDFNK